MKLQRTGITEAILLYDRWRKKHLLPVATHIEGEFINWLYSSSGWYDKSIKGSYFDIDTEAVVQSPIYHRWHVEFASSLKGCDYLEVMLWNKWIDAYFPNTYRDYGYFVNGFRAKENSLNETSRYYNYWEQTEKMFDFLKGRVLFVNPMAPLYLEQYDNAHKVYPKMPEFVPIIQEFPYCFFNDGPDGNGFETIDRIYKEIIKKDFDTAFISIGPYGCILSDRLQALGKTTLTVGSGLAKLFAIDPKATGKHWLTKIPAKYIPKDHLKIEGGRYWNGEKE